MSLIGFSSVQSDKNLYNFKKKKFNESYVGESRRLFHFKKETQNWSGTAVSNLDC